MNNKNDNIEMVILKTTSDNYELSLIKGLLDDASIPYVLKDHGIGGYMRVFGGSSLYGTDILVEASMFEVAMAIIDEFEWQD